VTVTVDALVCMSVAVFGPPLRLGLSWAFMTLVLSCAGLAAAGLVPGPKP
jgi:hypothetical protein